MQPHQAEWSLNIKNAPATCSLRQNEVYQHNAAQLIQVSTARLPFTGYITLQNSRTIFLKAAPLCRESCHLQLVNKFCYSLPLDDPPHLLNSLLCCALTPQRVVCHFWWAILSSWFCHTSDNVQVDANSICKLHGRVSSAMKQPNH